MKKLLAVCACTVLSLSLSGCSLGTVLEQITSTGDVSVGRSILSGICTQLNPKAESIWMKYQVLCRIFPEAS